jgi:peptide deformylase
VRLEDRDDRDALRLGQRDVFVDQVDVRVDHREPGFGLAAEEVGGTGRLVVQQLAEEHHLTSYQLIY